MPAMMRHIFQRKLTDGGRARSADPAPTRLQYRMERIARRPLFRFLRKRVAIPAIILGVGFYLYSEQPVRTYLAQKAEEAQEELMSRPEFAIDRVVVSGASRDLAMHIRNGLALDGPVSALELDLDALQERIETLPFVKSARLSVSPGDALLVEVEERKPVAIWQEGGYLHLVSADGVSLAPIVDRRKYAQLPLIVGDVDAGDFSSALQLVARMSDRQQELTALVRVGHRRWNMVLSNNITVMLPAEDAPAALSRILALDATTDLLSRDLVSIDMRNARHPVLALGSEAQEKLSKMRADQAAQAENSKVSSLSESLEEDA